MSDKKEIYLDGISQVHFINGMVRLDLSRLQPAENNPVPETFARLILPLPGFLDMMNTMQQFTDKLVENGVLQKTTNPKQ